MTFSVFIPARYGSTRLPAKPLREVGGKPLLQHVFECATASEADDVVIATDDERIRELAEGFGASVCMTSPDHRSGTDRLAEVAAAGGYGAERVVVNLQGDEPLMPPETINQTARNAQNFPEAGAATVCAPIRHSRELFDPNVVKVVFDHQGFAHYFSRAPIPWAREAFAKDRERLPPEGRFYRHIGLYAYRAGFLQRFVTWPVTPWEQIESLEQLRILWHGEKIHVEEAVRLPGPGVDTAEDLAQVEQILQGR